VTELGSRLLLRN